MSGGARPPNRPWSKAPVVVVDDEAPARRRLRGLVGDLGWAELVGEAEDGPAAVECIERLKPGLVFLDVQLPGINGIEVLKRLSHEPAIVFTTAFDQYAVTAFELQALDYLVKPFGADRFHRAAERARLTIAAPTCQRSRVERALSRTSLGVVFVRGTSKIIPIRTETIDRLQAQRDYVSIFVGGKEHLLSSNLSRVLDRLDPARFVRVHRSHAVNMERVESITPYDGGRLLLRLKDGSSVVASRSYSRILRTLFL